MTAVLKKLAGVVSFGKICIPLTLVENVFPCVVRERKEYGSTVILKILALISSLQNVQNEIACKRKSVPQGP